MASGWGLHDSRVSRIELVNGAVVINFSHAYIHKTAGKPGRDAGTGWSQEVQLVLSNATVSGPLPPLPNTIAEGYLEVGGIKHEILPLPFKRKVPARLFLQFADGAEANITGERPFVELLGKPVYLEDFG